MDAAELMRRKQSVIEVTHRPGWHVIHSIADETVKSMERAAIDEEDDLKGSALRREAKAARKFLNDFLKQIEVTCRVEVPEAAPAAAVDDDYEIAM